MSSNTSPAISMAALVTDSRQALEIEEPRSYPIEASSGGKEVVAMATLGDDSG